VYHEIDDDHFLPRPFQDINHSFSDDMVLLGYRRYRTRKPFIWHGRGEVPSVQDIHPFPDYMVWLQYRRYRSSNHSLMTV
jgi:hypothetical protein